MKKSFASVELVGINANTCPAGGITMPQPQIGFILLATISEAIRSFRRQIRI